MANKAQFKTKKKYLERKRRAYTETGESEWEEKGTGRSRGTMNSNIAPVLVNVPKDSTKQLQD